MDDSNFWKNKRVLVTGHTGFKGAWLTLLLSRMGAVVGGVALDPPTTPSLYDCASLDELLESDSRADIADLAGVKAAMNRFAPELVLHLAAQSLVRESYRDPLETYRTNVMGTLTVLEAARSCPSLRAVINVTTDKCYAQRELTVPFVETDPMGGSDPYSNSKGCSELLTDCYRRSFMQPEGAALLASARAGNVIGGGDWAADRLLPDGYRAFSRGEPLTIRYPKAIRPWQHVLEPLTGYLQLGRALLEGQNELATGWNFGPSTADALTVGDVATAACRIWGDGAAWVTDHEEHPHEAAWLQLDSTAARERLGWKTQLTAEEAVEWTIAWYRDFERGASARELCLEQVERYLGRGVCPQMAADLRR
ncbi:MAG: CDP-glucose 4,6-dehydratase [Lentisphaerae bacterium]|nr:CDP-glucose 4,6-dehydratase [Lentisphaerota bacterium]